ncbi:MULTISPECIES: hypothetical protein [Pseudomonas]|uniref:hypothetical protein n=1 Tax=Pseudomonas TaxID=286 RepID=UPI0018E6F972|nr:MULTISPECIES: hypothetical protein [Pseudomonas]MBJ2214905.1 hypothetical protein [Pseudomonas carnis]MBJ2229406.1 hypothetical protein [Pseudomonas simiae]USW96661.1 hypothetical protein NHF39_08800 [Pseudomonas proteolytica]USW99175.1 hypothetical protein NHF41_22515 [Pseudomonas proteolytica]
MTTSNTLIKIKPSNLYYTDYSETAVKGDDPKKTAEDADRFSRKEKYEVVDMINSIGWKDNNNTLKSLLIVEWMIHEKLPGTTQGRAKVKAWIHANYAALSKDYPR